jgi:hypothetical protein
MVTVKVLDNQTGESLPNAHVYPIVNGSPDYSRGSSTNLDGIAQISASTGEALQVTFIGYENYTFPVTSGMLFNPLVTARMTSSINNLNEAVIIGEKTKKKDWTMEIVLVIAVISVIAIISQIK